MVHQPQSEPSIQSNKGDGHSMIMALMMQLEGCV